MTDVPTVHCRPLGRHLTTKLVAEATFAQAATVLDAWAFAHGVVVARSVLGSVGRGFHEVVQVVGTPGRTASDADVLALLREDTALTRAVAAGVRVAPRGLEGLVVDAGDAAPVAAELLAASSRPYVPLSEVRATALDGPVVTPPRPRAPADVPAGRAAVVGRTWHVDPPASVRALVALRLLELVLGSDEHHAVLRPLRDAGTAYGVVARYLYDVAVLVVAVAGAYAPHVEHRVGELLDAAVHDRLAALLGPARRLYVARLRMAAVPAPVHHLGSYLLLDPTTTVDDLEALAHDVRPEELRAALDAPRHPLRQEVTGRGLL